VTRRVLPNHKQGQGWVAGGPVPHPAHSGSRGAVPQGVAEPQHPQHDAGGVPEGRIAQGLGLAALVSQLKREDGGVCVCACVRERG
jgi:hypothetical protein